MLLLLSYCKRVYHINKSHPEHGQKVSVAAYHYQQLDSLEAVTDVKLQLMAVMVPVFVVCNFGMLADLFFHPFGK